MPAFTTTVREPWQEGFHIGFPNGYTVSVQFGQGAYSDRGETTAEVAVFDERDFVFVPGFSESYDDVRGHVTAQGVAEVISVVARAYPGQFKPRQA